MVQTLSKKIKHFISFKIGFISTIAGGTRGSNDGQGTLAQFYITSCVTMDSIGNIYVGDYCAIRMINSSGLEKKLYLFLNWVNNGK